MQNDLISIIVPCYNLETYTEKCINSILNQTYKNLEVIVIDDGSTDNTAQILQKYADIDERIVFLQQSNKGAGVAINRGIDVAKGKYIGFVDNDDWIDSQMYEKLYSKLIKTDSDMAVCNFNLVYEDMIKKNYAEMHELTVNIMDDIYGYFCNYCACRKPNNYTWSRLYKTDIIKNSDVRFEMFRMGADTLFNFKLLPLIKRVTFINDGLYNYVQRSTSSVHIATQKGNLAELYADVFDSLVDYYKEHEYSEFESFLPIYAFTRIRSIFFYSRMAGLDDEQITEEIMSNFKNRKIKDYLIGTVV